MSGAKVVAAIALVAVASVPARAGENDVTPPPGAPAAHGVSVLVGLGASSVREDLLTPYAFTGPAPELQVGYQRRVGPGALRAEARVALGVLSDRFENQAGGLHHELAVGYERALPLGRGAGGVGAVLRANTDVAYLESWDDAHAYWLAGLTLGPSFSFNRALGARTRLEARGDLALVALASRPPERRLNKQDALKSPAFYFGRLGQDPAARSALDAQWARAGVALRRKAEGRADGQGWGVGLEVRFSHASWPQDFTTLYTGVALSRGWAW